MNIDELKVNKIYYDDYTKSLVKIKYYSINGKWITFEQTKALGRNKFVWNDCSKVYIKEHIYDIDKYERRMLMI